MIIYLDINIDVKYDTLVIKEQVQLQVCKILTGYKIVDLHNFQMVKKQLCYLF